MTNEHKFRYFQHLRSAEASGNKRKDRPSLLRLSGFTQRVMAQGVTCDGQGRRTARTGRPRDVIATVGTRTTPSRPGLNTGELCSPSGLD